MQPIGTSSPANAPETASRVASPRVAVTLNAEVRSAEPAITARKNDSYLRALLRAGATPLPLDEATSASDLATVLESMDGLLITGGPDLDPARYGEAPAGANPPHPGRDALDAEAYAIAAERGVPILGVCRGLQAINVFSGGRLVQHLDGHESGPYPATAETATRHPMQVVPGTRLAEVLDTDELVVNSFHHQAVDRQGLARGLVVAATVDDPAHGELVEALEAADKGRWLVAVQCHPERVESSPAALQQLWSAFVEACATRRSPAAGVRR
jgi:putative glutamine amidotransferase